MVRLRVLEILEEQGKTRYWLNKRMEMHYVSFKNMIENNTNSIRFETLDKLSIQKINKDMVTLQPYLLK